MKHVDVMEALFPNMSFVDCAVKIRKMSSPADLVPFVEQGFGICRKDVDECPMKFDADFIREVLGNIPPSEDPLYGGTPDAVSDALDPPLYNVLTAIRCMRFVEKNGMAKFMDAIRKIDAAGPEAAVKMFEAVNKDVREITGQVSFLWHSFHESAPNIATVTKDAFDLVQQTKLQTNLTPDMLDKAFERDMFLELPKPINGFMELAFLRRGDYVAVAVGRKQKRCGMVEEANLFTPAFSVIEIANISKQIGSMTEESISATFDEGAQQIANWLSDLFDAQFKGSEDYDELRRNFDERMRNDGYEQRTPEQKAVAARIMSDAMIFAAKLRLMLLVEKPPMEEVFSSAGQSRSHEGISMPPSREGGVSYSVVSLTKGFREARMRYERSGGQLDKFGKKLVEKFIAGFIRRQHYGKDNALVKTIFVSPFTNRFWMNEGIRITKIVK